MVTAATVPVVTLAPSTFWRGTLQTAEKAREAKEVVRMNKLKIQKNFTERFAAKFFNCIL
jgi:hypothetical protein